MLVIFAGPYYLFLGETSTEMRFKKYYRGKDLFGFISCPLGRHIGTVGDSFDLIRILYLLGRNPL